MVLSPGLAVESPVAAVQALPVDVIHLRTCDKRQVAKWQVKVTWRPGIKRFGWACAAWLAWSSARRELEESFSTHRAGAQSLVFAWLFVVSQLCPSARLQGTVHLMQEHYSCRRCFMKPKLSIASRPGMDSTAAKLPLT